MDPISTSDDSTTGRPPRPSSARPRRPHPGSIVLSGDLTQRAKIREYEAARAYLKRLPGVPTVLTPGNHDVPLYRILERWGAPVSKLQALHPGGARHGNPGPRGDGRRPELDRAVARDRERPDPPRADRIREAELRGGAPGRFPDPGHAPPPRLRSRLREGPALAPRPGDPCGPPGDGGRSHPRRPPPPCVRGERLGRLAEGGAGSRDAHRAVRHHDVEARAGEGEGRELLQPDPGSAGSRSKSPVTSTSGRRAPSPP